MTDYVDISGVSVKSLRAGVKMWAGFGYACRGGITFGNGYYYQTMINYAETINDYTVTVANTVDKSRILVRGFISTGWTCQGGVFVYGGQYYQALAK